MLPKQGVSGISRQIWLACILSSWSLMSSCHSLSGDFCSEKRNLAVSLTAPECFQEITPTWLSAVLHFHAGVCISVIPQGKLVQFLHGLLDTAAVVITVVHFYLSWPWRYLLCTHPVLGSFSLSLATLSLLVLPRVLGVPYYLCYCSIWLPAATF